MDNYILKRALVLTTEARKANNRKLKDASEGYEPLNDKRKEKIDLHYLKHRVNSDGSPRDASPEELKRGYKVGKIIRAHNPAKSRLKAIQNRRRGASKK